MGQHGLPLQAERGLAQGERHGEPHPPQEAPGAAPWASGPPRPTGRKSSIRAKVEHVFARRKDRMALAVRTVGMARAKVAITLANMAYNMNRLRWLCS